MKFACPNCNQHFDATEDSAGQATICPTCNNSLVVPLLPAPPEKWYLSIVIVILDFVGDGRKIIQDTSKLPSEFKQTFSTATITNAHENERYKDASISLLIAGILFLFLAWAGAKFSKNAPAMKAFDTVWTNDRDWLIGGIIGLCFVSLVPASLARRNRLSYLMGTLSNLLAFGLIAFFMALLVRKSGGIFNSIFGTTFMSLFAVALFVPESIPVRILLYVCAFCFNVNVWVDSYHFKGVATFHCDLVVSILSQLSFVTAAAAKAIIDLIRSKK